MLTLIKQIDFSKLTTYLKLIYSIAMLQSCQMQALGN